MTKEQLLKMAEFDCDKNAKMGIEDADRWEVFATKVDPQPFGTPKYIFRTGHAIASINEHKRLIPLISALAESNEELMEALKDKDNHWHHPSEDIGDFSRCTACIALASHAARMDKLNSKGEPK